MKNLTNVINFVVLAFAVVCLSSCGKYCEIEQKVTVHHYCDDTRIITTYVWVRDWNGFPVSLEYSQYDFDINSETADSVKSVRMMEATVIKSKIEECIKNSK